MKTAYSAPEPGAEESAKEFFNRLRLSAESALIEFSEIRVRQDGYSRLYEP